MHDKKQLLRAALPFIFFWAGYWLFRLVISTEEVKAPMIIGYTVIEALQELSKQDLSLKVIDIRYEDNIDVSRIVSQHPVPETLIKKHQPICCVITQKKENKISQENVFSITEHNYKSLCGNLTQLHYLSHNLLKGSCIAHTSSLNKKNELQQTHCFFSQGAHHVYVMPVWKGLSIDAVQQTLQYFFPEALILHAQECGIKKNCTCTIIDQKPHAGVVIDMRKKPMVQLLVSP